MGCDHLGVKSSGDLRLGVPTSGDRTTTLACMAPKATFGGRTRPVSRKKTRREPSFCSTRRLSGVLKRAPRPRFASEGRIPDTYHPRVRSQNRAPIGVAEVAIHFGYRGQRRPGVGATWTLSVGTFKEGPGVYVRAPPHVACHGTYSS